MKLVKGHRERFRLWVFLIPTLVVFAGALDSETHWRALGGVGAELLHGFGPELNAVRYWSTPQAKALVVKKDSLRYPSGAVSTERAPATAANSNLPKKKINSAENYVMKVSPKYWVEVPWKLLLVVSSAHADQTRPGQILAGLNGNNFIDAGGGNNNRQAIFQALVRNYVNNLSSDNANAFSAQDIRQFLLKNDPRVLSGQGEPDEGTLKEFQAAAIAIKQAQNGNNDQQDGGQNGGGGGGGAGAGGGGGGGGGGGLGPALFGAAAMVGAAAGPVATGFAAGAQKSIAGTRANAETAMTKINSDATKGVADDALGTALVQGAATKNIAGMTQKGATDRAFIGANAAAMANTRKNLIENEKEDSKQAMALATDMIGAQQLRIKNQFEFLSASLKNFVAQAVSRANQIRSADDLYFANRNRAFYSQDPRAAYAYAPPLRNPGYVPFGQMPGPGAFAPMAAAARTTQGQLLYSLRQGVPAVGAARPTAVGVVMHRSLAGGSNANNRRRLTTADLNKDGLALANRGVASVSSDSSIDSAKPHGIVAVSDSDSDGATTTTHSVNR